MGMAVLAEILLNWQEYDLEESIYLPLGAEPSLHVLAAVLPADRWRKRVWEGQEYFLGIEQIRDVIEGLEAQLGRSATLDERFQAVVHYAKYDAFIDIEKLR